MGSSRIATPDVVVIGCDLLVGLRVSVLLIGRPQLSLAVPFLEIRRMLLLPFGLG